MFCKKCGNQLSDDALFCNNCGAMQKQDGQGQDQGRDQTGQYSPPASPPSGQPGAYYQPPGQYAPPPAPNMGGSMPPKNNTTKIILISLAGLCVVIAAVLIVVLLKPFSPSGDDVIDANLPSSFQDDLNDPGYGDADEIFLPDNDGEDDDEDDGVLDNFVGDSDNTPAPTDAETSDAVTEPSGSGNHLAPSPSAETSDTDTLTVFDTPVWSSEPIYIVIDEGGPWISVGIASNPNQINGEDGIFYLSDFSDCMYYVEFFADQTWKMKYIEDITGVETRDYELMDIEYCDTFMDDDGLGYRFYNGNDGRLYMCLYGDMGDGTYPDLTDFVVLERNGSIIDWTAEAAAN